MFIYELSGCGFKSSCSHLITNQSHFFLFFVKFLRKSYLILFLDTFKKIVLFVITNQVFDLLIHVSFMCTFHDIHESFNCDSPKDVRGIFLDISKIFDGVWNEGPICKMKSIDIQVCL